MSYILDALKRADSEREREREDVPGLHSKTDVWVAPDEVRAAASKPHAAVWALAAAGGAAVLGLLWLLLTREAVLGTKAGSTAGSAVGSASGTAPVTPSVAPALAVPPALPLPALPLPALAAPALAAPTPPAARLSEPIPRAVVSAALPAQSPQAVAAKPRAAVSAMAPVAAARAASVATSGAASGAASGDKPTVAAVPPVPPVPPATPPPEARTYSLAELPEEVRAGLPALVVGGAMYSQTPANRMLIVNGQVYREGDAVAPGLVLEQIKLKSAVLKVKGLRYGISY